MNLSRNFTLEEMTLSDYAERNGVANIAPADVIKSLGLLCIHVLQPLRDDLKAPVIVLSGYRSPVVNAGVGGQDDSQHMALNDDAAADIRVNGMTASELFHFIAERYPFDQLIEEYGKWVHVSYAPVCRRQKLLARKEGKKTRYTPAA